MMPLLYPVVDKTNNDILLKQITHQFVLKSKFSYGDDFTERCKNFLTKYIKMSLFNTDENNVCDYVKILHAYANKNKTMNDYQDNIDNESVDYIFNEIYEPMPESKDPKLDTIISKYKNFSKKSLRPGGVNANKTIYDMDKFINETKYLHYRKIEIEKEIEDYKSLPLFCNGLIKFKNRLQKVEFLKSGAGIFGVHLQGRNVRFYDADFCNVLEFIQFRSDDFKIHEILDFINSSIKIQGYEGELFNIPEFQFQNKINAIDTETKIYLRCNGFLDALKIYEKLNSRMTYSV
jgi:hypothetical protein